MGLRLLKLCIYCGLAGVTVNSPEEESKDNIKPEEKSSTEKAEDGALVVAAPISSMNQSSTLEGKEYRNLTNAGNQGRILIDLFTFYSVEA